jgi:hypothetical protein
MPNSSDRKVVFWSCDDGDEHLSYTDMDEAIEMALDDSGQLDGTIIAYGFSRMRINRRDCGDVLGDLIERLDEEYGSPEGPDDIPEIMRAAEDGFLRIVLAHYVPWACEVVEQHEINVASWVREHRPDWLEEP